jgi:membrane associated rhomboid family serine protease
MRPSPKQLLYGYPIAVLATFCTTTPTVGISAVIYAYIGLYIIYRKLSNYDLLTFIIANIITIFIPNLATTMHMVSFFIGLLCAMVYKRYEYRRVNS